MGTDVSDFSAKYSQRSIGSAASGIVLPDSITVNLHGLRFPNSAPMDVSWHFERVSYETRYGTNPHQDFRMYRRPGKYSHLGDMKIHKLGKGGFSKTNLEDISQGVNTQKFMPIGSAFALKHIVPCGGVITDLTAANVPIEQIIEFLLRCDPRSVFGGTIVVNGTIDEKAAEKIMGIFIENVVATGYTPDALAVLRRNEGTKKLNSQIRVVEIPDMQNLPKYWGDPVLDYLTLKSMPTGELTIEVPYLTAVRSVGDFIIDPEVAGECAKRPPTEQELKDGLSAWYTAMNVRSNAVVLVKKGQAIGIGTGQLDRVGAVENAVDKARKYGHDLEGAVMASDAFFPKPDAVEYAAQAGVRAFVWPAGSRQDKEIIEAGNKHDMAMMVPISGERCFLHV